MTHAMLPVMVNMDVVVCVPHCEPTDAAGLNETDRTFSSATAAAIASTSVAYSATAFWPIILLKLASPKQFH